MYIYIYMYNLSNLVYHTYHLPYINLPYIIPSSTVHTLARIPLYVLLYYTILYYDMRIVS